MRDEKKLSKEDAGQVDRAVADDGEWVTARQITERTGYSDQWPAFVHAKGTVRRRPHQNWDPHTRHSPKFEYSWDDVCREADPKRLAAKDRVKVKQHDGAWITVNEAATATRLTVRAVQGAARRNLVTSKKDGSRRLVLRADVLKWASARGKRLRVLPAMPQDPADSPDIRSTILIQSPRTALKWAIEGRDRNYLSDDEFRAKVAQFAEQVQ